MTKQPTKFVCGDITVYCGRCEDVLPTLSLPDDYVVCTDPPFTVMTVPHCTEMLAALHLAPKDYIVLTNPLSGYIHRDEFRIVPELSTTVTEWHRHQRPLD